MFSCKLVECAVPQGWSQGPILFLMFINYIANLGINCKICLFVGDIGFVSNYLITIKSWCDSNLQYFNVSKTKLLS